MDCRPWSLVVKPNLNWRTGSDLKPDTIKNLANLKKSNSHGPDIDVIDIQWQPRESSVFLNSCGIDDLTFEITKVYKCTFCTLKDLLGKRPVRKPESNREHLASAKLQAKFK